MGSTVPFRRVLRASPAPNVSVAPQVPPDGYGGAYGPVGRPGEFVADGPPEHARGNPEGFQLA
jgi:hypothetical protein